MLLRDKANSLEGYVVPFNLRENIVDKILKDNPEIAENNSFKKFKV